MLKIVCNNIPRLAIHFSDLPAEVQAEFGHVESKETDYFIIGQWLEVTDRIVFKRG